MYDEFARRSDALLQGRRTYQVSAAAWPTRSGDPFSDWINRVQKYVVSNTLTEKDLAWHPTTIIRGDCFVEAVSALRAELLLTIEPVILGGGKTIFARDGRAIPFTLESTARASTGAQVCRYVRAR